MEMIVCLFVCLVAIVMVPVTAHVVGKELRVGHAAALDHLKEAARVGEPRDITEKRLELEAEKIRLQELVQREVMERRKARSVVDVTS